MSRFSVFVHQHFGTDPNQSVADILIKFIPDTGTLGQAKEVIVDAVSVMEGTGLTGDEKKKLVTAVVNFALGALHITLPASLVSYLIEEAVVLLKGGKPSTVPTAPPVQASIYGNFDKQPVPDRATLLTQGYKVGDVVWGYGTVLYTVVQPGSVPPLTAPDGTPVGNPLLTL